MADPLDLTDPTTFSPDDPDWRWKPLVETNDGSGTSPSPGNWVPRTGDPEEEMRLLAMAQGKPWPPAA